MGQRTTRTNEREAKGGEHMQAYVFNAVLEPDGDAWRAYVPALEAQGAATWGKTKDEALKNLEEVTQMVVETLLEDGESLPDGVTVSNQPVVAVNVG